MWEEGVCIYGIPGVLNNYLLEMVVSKMRYEWQVKSRTRLVLWHCQVSSSLLQNNKCWIISTNKTLFISKKIPQAEFGFVTKLFIFELTLHL